MEVDAFAAVEHVDDLRHQRVHLCIFADSLICTTKEVRRKKGRQRKSITLVCSVGRSAGVSCHRWARGGRRVE
jgi:hypothetical protein